MQTQAAQGVWVWIILWITWDNLGITGLLPPILKIGAAAAVFSPGKGKSLSIYFLISSQKNQAQTGAEAQFFVGKQLSTLSTIAQSTALWKTESRPRKDCMCDGQKLYRSYPQKNGSYPQFDSRKILDQGAVTHALGTAFQSGGFLV